MKIDKGKGREERRKKEKKARVLLSISAWHFLIHVLKEESLGSRDVPFWKEASAVSYSSSSKQAILYDNMRSEWEREGKREKVGRLKRDEIG